MSETLRRWLSFKEVYDGVTEFLDLVERGERVAGGEAFVIDDSLFSRVAEEAQLVNELRYSAIELVDPWEQGVSVAALTGSDLKESMEEAGRIQRSYDAIDGDIQTLENEISSSKELLSSFESEAQMIYSLQKSIEPHLSEISSVNGELPYWYMDVDRLYLALNSRNTDLSRKITATNIKLRESKNWRDQHAIRRDDANRWMEKVISDKITLNQKEIYNKIYDEVSRLAGEIVSERSKRQIAGLLTAIVADNSRVQSEANALRADAEAIRSKSNVGPSLFDFLLGLASIGSGLVDSSSSGSVGSGSNMQTSSKPNSIEIKLKHGGEEKTYRRPFYRTKMDDPS